MFHTRLRWLSVGLLALLSIMAIIPQGSGVRAQESIELRVWDQFTEPTESATVDSIYAAFTEANPNITIVREAFALDQLRETVNTAIASGTGPDVIFYDAGPGYAGVLANAGLLTPLGPYAEQYGWTERIAPSSLEATSINGEPYGLPLTVDLIGMYYNQDLIEQEGLTVPQTFDELVTFCGQASEKGYIPFAFGNLDGWPAFHQFSMMVNQMLGPEAMNQLLTNNGGSWDSPEVVAAINHYFVELKDAGCYSEDANALNYDDANSLFFSGQSLLHPTGSWLVNDIQTNMPDANIGFMQFPELSDGTGALWVSGVGSAYYITSGTQNADAAAMFLDYLFSPETVARWVGEAQFLVPVEFDASTIEASPLFGTVLETLQTATEQGVQFGYNVDVLAPPQFNDALLSGLQAIIAGDKTPEELAAELEAAWDEGMPDQASPEA